MDFFFGLLFWFCLALALFGLVTIVVGVIIQVVYFDGSAFIQTSFLAAPSLLIFIGIVIFIVAFLGCCGAAKKNHFFLITFSTLMFFMFVLGFAGSIASYYSGAQIEDQLEKNFNETIIKYPTNDKVQKSWDIMQSDLKCCGINSPDDWKSIVNITIPVSCCHGTPISNGTEPPKCNPDDIYKEGCMQKLVDSVSSQSRLLGILAIVICLIQISVVMFTCYLSGVVRSEYMTV